MDAVHAWDQQDIHFYVPHWIDHSVDQVIRYQTSLRGALPRPADYEAGTGWFMKRRMLAAALAEA